MATSEDTLNRFMKYIDDDHITTRKMMGEYIIYFDKTVVGGLYDNRLLIKSTPSSSEILKDCKVISPYPNAKQMIHYPNIEDSETILKVVKQVKNVFLIYINGFNQYL